MVKSTKKVLSGMLWMARGTATMLGFAVMLAIVLGVGTTALAAVPGDPFELGETNTIDNALTKLAGSNAGGPMLVVDNDSTASGSRALDLRVEAGRAPINVNADAGRAANLNADKVDGKGADQIGVNGLEVVEERSQSNSDSQKTEIAECPDGKVVVGSGYEISNGFTGNFPNILTDVVPTIVGVGDTVVTVQAMEEQPTNANWQVEARAICATAP